MLAQRRPHVVLRIGNANLPQEARDGAQERDVAPLHADRQHQRVKAVALGAAEGEFAGLLPAEATAAQIDAALRAVAAGLTVRAPGRQRRMFGPLPEEASVLLTPREVEVLAALGNGLSNKAAARQLGISPHTIKFHIESLFRKLDATSRAEAVAKGLRRQIVEF